MSRNTILTMGVCAFFLIALIGNLANAQSQGGPLSGKLHSEVSLGGCPTMPPERHSGESRNPEIRMSPGSRLSPG